MNDEQYLLWESDDFAIRTLRNPHIPYSEGLHIIITPKREIACAWEDVTLAGKTFEVASSAAKIMEELNLAPWFNIEAKGNWGLLPGRTPSFHIHIYGRNKTAMWGKPLVLPELPGTFKNEPMPESDRKIISAGLLTGLQSY